MKKWVISHDLKVFYPELLSAAVKQASPTLTFAVGEKSFNVEFQNRSDYHASHGSGQYAVVEMITKDRRRFTAYAAFKEV